MKTGETEAARRIRTVLADARLAGVFKAVRDRLERDAGGRTVDLTGLDRTEREALAGLLGAASIPDGRLRVPLARIDEALRSSQVEASLIEVVEALGGPIRDARGEREAKERRREGMWAEAARHPAVAHRPQLLEWLADLRRGVLTRAATAARRDPGTVLDEALRFAARLPASGVHRGQLAAEVSGDAHALDPGAAVTPLVLRAAARLAGEVAVPSGAAERRTLWEAVGVFCDELSADVLVLGLRAEGASRVVRNLNEAAAAGEPVRVTLRELREPLQIQPTELYVCENPLVMATAADALGATCAPLLCVEGMPTTAAARVLEAARRARARLRFHVDFDWGGIRIGNVLVARWGAEPWRVSAAEYRLAADRVAAAAELDGRPVSALWDSDLMPTMQRTGRAVFEEQVVAELLADLATD